MRVCDSDIYERAVANYCLVVKEFAAASASLE